MLTVRSLALARAPCLIMSAMEGEAEEELDRIVTGLVREWLFRKGLTDVLARFDDETVSWVTPGI